jgi:hypothetical protein
MKYTFWALLAMAVWVVAATSQQTSGPAQGPSVKIEGEITSLSMTAPGPPSLTVKNAEGVEYLVHFGPLRMLRNQGFSPKVGDSVTVNGFFCCEVEGKQMIHSSEITLGGKTYAMPMTPERMTPGRMRMPSGSNMPCEAGNCPNCPHAMQEGARHEMHHHQMHHSMHHL